MGYLHSHEDNIWPSPDAIVLDVTMPCVGGIEACALIRGRGSNVPIVMLTASLERGTRTHLTKPFALDDLLAHLRKLLS
jgi:two-component system response regulator MprA